jgi:hypothetical protein
VRAGQVHQCLLLCVCFGAQPVECRDSCSRSFSRLRLQHGEPGERLAPPEVGFSVMPTVRQTSFRIPSRRCRARQRRSFRSVSHPADTVLFGDESHLAAAREGSICAQLDLHDRVRYRRIGRVCWARRRAHRWLGSGAYGAFSDVRAFVRAARGNGQSKPPLRWRRPIGSSRSLRTRRRPVAGSDVRGGRGSRRRGGRTARRSSCRRGDRR